MERETLREWLKRQPFQPFRVHVADGRTFDVIRPRINLLAQTYVKIGIPDLDNPSPFACLYTEYVPLAQITHLEPLASPSLPKVSGKD